MRGKTQIAGFARRMLRTLNLPKNAEKPGWETMTVPEMMGKLTEEYVELMTDLNMLSRMDEKGASNPQLYALMKKKVAEEATDLGNVSMIVCDNVGGLNE